jgi:hypothetical protein
VNDILPDDVEAVITLCAEEKLQTFRGVRDELRHRLEAAFGA